MDFKRYFGKIKNKTEKSNEKPKIVDEIQENTIKEIKPEIKKVDVNAKKILNFVLV